MTASEAAHSRMRHVLTNVLGGSEDRVQVDVDMLRLENGDRLVLCSDGLTDLVDDETIAKALAAAPRSSEACTRLVDLALAGGGKDNITVIVAGYTLPAEQAT